MPPSIRAAVGIAILAAAPLTVAQDFPKLKPGLWEMTMTTGKRDAPRLSSICLDDSVQREMYKMSTGMMAGMCTKHEIKVLGNKVTTIAGKAPSDDRLLPAEPLECLRISIDDVAKRIEKNTDLLSRGVDRLSHAIMDGSVDAYFPLLDKLDEFVDSLEQRVIIEFDQSALAEIFAVKRLVLSLRRHVGPEREVFNILTNRPSQLLSPESQIYFRDIYDHVLRINDSIETYRDLLSSVLDSYLTQVSNRLGRVTKGLSVIATLSIPFVVISGMWGMNFDHIPLSGHPLWP